MTSRSLDQELAGVDAPALTAWPAQHMPAIPAPITVRAISAGRSNLTFSVEDASGARYVLRRPPVGSLETGAHGVGREYRILSTLAGATVPVPGTVAQCSDSGITGAPFFPIRTRCTSGLCPARN